MPVPLDAMNQACMRHAQTKGERERCPPPKKKKASAPPPRPYLLPYTAIAQLQQLQKTRDTLCNHVTTNKSGGKTKRHTPRTNRKTKPVTHPPRPTPKKIDTHTDTAHTTLPSVPLPLLLFSSLLFSPQTPFPGSISPVTLSLPTAVTSSCRVSTPYQRFSDVLPPHPVDSFQPLVEAVLFPGGGGGEH